MLIPNYTKLEKFFLENRKKIEHYLFVSNCFLNMPTVSLTTE